MDYGLKAVGGRVISTSHGNFVVGFSPNLGTCSITVAELSDIYQGIQLAKSRGYTKSLAAPF